MCSFGSGYRPFCSYWWKHWFRLSTYTHPFVFAYQRTTRGWADCDTWSLDDHLSRVLVGALAHLKENTHGHPFPLTEQKWDQILDDMIAGFKEHRDHNYNNKFDEKVFNKGMKLFNKWYRSLWD